MLTLSKIENLPTVMSLFTRPAPITAPIIELETPLNLGVLEPPPALAVPLDLGLHIARAAVSYLEGVNRRLADDFLQSVIIRAPSVAMAAGAGLALIEGLIAKPEPCAISLDPAITVYTCFGGAELATTTYSADLQLAAFFSSTRFQIEMCVFQNLLFYPCLLNLYFSALPGPVQHEAQGPGVTEATIDAMLHGCFQSGGRWKTNFSGQYAVPYFGTPLSKADADAYRHDGFVLALAMSIKHSYPFPVHPILLMYLQSRNSQTASWDRLRGEVLAYFDPDAGALLAKFDALGPAGTILSAGDELVHAFQTVYSRVSRTMTPHLFEAPPNGCPLAWSQLLSKCPQQFKACPAQARSSQRDCL